MNKKHNYYFFKFFLQFLSSNYSMSINVRIKLYTSGWSGMYLYVESQSPPVVTLMYYYWEG